jgi:NADH-quinone oxidoreductase subunit N
VTLGLVLAVALAAGLASVLAAPRFGRLATWIGIAGAIACLALGLGLDAGDALTVGGLGLGSSDGVRLVAVGWSATAGMLGIVGIVTGGATLTVGPSLLAMGASLVAIAGDDPGVAFAALAIAGLVAVLVPTLGAWLADPEVSAPLAIAGRAIAAAAGPGVAAVLLVAWSRSAVGPFGAVTETGSDGIDVGLAMALLVLATAALVVTRAGAIPAHLWAARFIGAVSPLAVPAALAWGSAAFALVAIAWARSAVAAGAHGLDDPGRALVLLVALATIVLGGLAAILHDDVEHVLGYSIIQDAGVALLAFASLRPETADAARDWLVASAALKSALAGWTALARSMYGVHRLSELGGWARRSPGLAVAAALVLVGSVGLPGMAIFGARVTLATAALPGPLGYLVVALALSPILALGRVLVVGIGRPTTEVAGVSRARVGLLVIPRGGWSRGGLSVGALTWAARTARAAARENGALVAVLATVLLAVVGLALAILGTGTGAA